MPDENRDTPKSPLFKFFTTTNHSRSKFVIFGVAENHGKIRAGAARASACAARELEAQAPVPFKKR